MTSPNRPTERERNVKRKLNKMKKKKTTATTKQIKIKSSRRMCTRDYRFLSVLVVNFGERDIELQSAPL